MLLKRHYNADLYNIVGTIFIPETPIQNAYLSVTKHFLHLQLG